MSPLDPTSHTCGCFTLMLGQKPLKSVKQLSLHLKIKKIPHAVIEIEDLVCHKLRPGTIKQMNMKIKQTSREWSQCYWKGQPLNIYNCVPHWALLLATGSQLFPGAAHVRNMTSS